MLKKATKKKIDRRTFEEGSREKNMGSRFGYRCRGRNRNFSGRILPVAKGGEKRAKKDTLKWEKRENIGRVGQQYVKKLLCRKGRDRG